MNILHIQQSYQKAAENSRLDVISCYTLWKNTEGLVNAKYARKVVGMSEKKFKEFCQTSRVPIIKKQFPDGRPVNLYPLRLLKDLAGQKPVEYINKTLEGNQLRKIIREEEWQRDLGDYEALLPEEKRGISLSNDKKLFCVKVKGNRKKVKRLYEALVLKERFRND